MKKNEPNLFGDLDELATWKEHWGGMPEFIQNDETPYQQVIINFRSKEDLEEFAKLIEQKITYKTKSVWFPKLNNEKPSNFVYTDEQ